MNLDARAQQSVLWIGDLLVIGLVTLFGFASHGELNQSGWRMLTTFIPLALAWFFVGLPVGMFDLTLAGMLNQLWRPLWGAVLTGPLAVLLRSLLLGFRPVIPTFAIVITSVFGFAVLVWRLIFYSLFHRKGLKID